MTDWPLLIFVACGGALILIIGLLNITDLDSFFAGMALVIDGVASLPGMLIDGLLGGSPEPVDAPPDIIKR